MVSHGHLTVNGKKYTIPSHQVKADDIIGVREGSKKAVLFENFAETHEAAGIPSWLKFDVKKMEGTVVGFPSYEPSETLFDPEQVLEYYSR